MLDILTHIEAGELPPWWEADPPLLVLSGCTWSSTGGGQRPVQLARQWQRAGREVLYVNNATPTLQANEGIICGNHNHLAKWLPQLAQWQGDVFCGFPAYWQQLQGRLSHWRAILDICDDWEEFARIESIPADCWDEPEIRRAFAAADVVTYTAACLKQFCKRYGAKRSVLVPNGGPELPVKCAETPADMQLGKGINVVYCGALWGKWLDWQTLVAMAHELLKLDPGSTVHIIGGMDNAGDVPPEPEANMRCYGERPYAEAMQYVAACDVMVIPFQIEVLCKAVDPNKWHDAMACGVPVVATDVLQDLKGRPHTYLCPPQKLAKTVLQAAKAGRIPAEEVATLTADHAWSRRAAQILAEFAKVPVKALPPPPVPVVVPTPDPPRVDVLPEAMESVPEAVDVAEVTPESNRRLARHRRRRSSLE